MNRMSITTDPIRDWPTADEAGGNAVWQLIVSRLKEFFREPSAIFWVYGFPIVMMIALGIAFREGGPPVIHVAVQAGPAAAEIAERLESASAAPSSATEAPVAPASRFAVEVFDKNEARRKLRTGRVALLIVAKDQAPDDDAHEAESGAATELATTHIEYFFDPTRPDGSVARAAVDDVLQRAAGRRDVMEAEIHTVSERGGRYIDFVIPGLLGASLMSGGLWGVGFVTVDMRVRNLLKRYVTTPMRRSHFLAGLMISRFFFMVTEVVLLLIFAHFAFDTAMFGSLWLLLLLVVLGALTFAGVGLVVASRARTLETASGLMNLVMLPMWLLSGIFFSSERFPAAFQPVIQILPLTPLINSMRAVMLEGATTADVAGEMAILALWGVACFAFALRFFRWS